MFRFISSTFTLFLAVILSGSLAQTPDFSGLTIVLDPGHGGHESDDRGMPNGFWESEGNFTKATWLHDLLMDRGCNVILTRYGNDDDVADDPSLSERPQVAIDNNADLFISIHSNAGNQVSNYPMTIFNGKTATPSVPSSKVWATVLWQHLKTNEATFWTPHDGKVIGDLTLNPTWSNGYGVLVPLNSYDLTGIISEGSFHDYGPEVDRLLNLEYRKQEAWNIYYALVDYFELEGQEIHGNISGIIRDSLLMKDHYSIANSPDAYENVNGARVELLETGEVYQVDTLDTGFYMFDSISPGTYHLEFSAQDYYTDTIEVEVVAHKFAYQNYWMRADKSMPPKILGYGPKGEEAVPCFDPVTIAFNMNMDSASVAEAFSVNPEVPGTFSWDRKHLNMNFQPDVPYETETLYSVELDTTAMHQWGIRLDSSLNFSFTTDDRNRMSILDTYPAEGQKDISTLTQFQVIFDAPLNNTSLIDAISIKAEDGSMHTSKASVITSDDEKGHYYFEADPPLSYSSSYTLFLDGSIQDENHIPLFETRELSFSTMADPGPVTVLDSMHNTDEWKLDYTLSQGIDNTSFLYRRNNKYVAGPASTMLRYNFLDQTAYCVFGPEEPIKLDSRLDSIGFWIRGERSSQELKLGFDNMEEVQLCTVDFPGWAYRVAEIPEGAQYFTHVILTRANEEIHTGDIFFDLLLQPGSFVGLPDKILSDFRVYPNPLAGDELHLDGLPPGESSYRIFSIKGRLLLEGKLAAGNTGIYLGELHAAHSLILEINNPEGSYRTLIIKQ